MLVSNHALMQLICMFNTIIGTVASMGCKTLSLLMGKAGLEICINTRGQGTSLHQVCQVPSLQGLRKVSSDQTYALQIWQGSLEAGILHRSLTIQFCSNPC